MLETKTTDTKSNDEMTTINIPYIECPAFKSLQEAEEFDSKYFQDNPQCQQFLRLCAPKEWSPDDYLENGAEDHLVALVVQVFPGLISRDRKKIQKEAFHEILDSDFFKGEHGTELVNEIRANAFEGWAAKLKDCIKTFEGCVKTLENFVQEYRLTYKLNEFFNIK